MKIKHIITTAALAIAAIAAPVAHAAFSYVSGDLFLGFRQIGNNTSDFLVNIGNGQTYRQANDPLSPITLTLSNLSSTLDTIFNTTSGGWATNSNVRWGIFGTTQNDASGPDATARTLYVSEPVGSAAPLNGSSAAQNVPASNMIAVKNYYQSLTESAVVNGSVGTPANANSFTTRTSGTPFAFSNISPVIAPITTNLELFRLPTNVNGPTTDEGTFSISGNTLTFTPVPEPSTYAFMFLGTVGFAYIAVRYFRKVNA